MKNYTQRLENIEVVLQKKLPQMFEQADLQNLFLTLPQAVNNSHLQPLTEPCRNLLLLGGKRWRPLLLVLCAEIFCKTQKPEENEKLLAAYNAVPLVEFVHTASLIHDDIEDAADMRRGKPAAHIAYGVDTALNSGSWLYFAAFSSINMLQIEDSVKLELYKMLAAELRRLHLGQAMDIAWHRNNNFVPGRDEYEAMVRLKTGTLACLAAKVGSLIAGAGEEDCNFLGLVAADIGVGFQVLDDVINLTTGNVGKKRGDDIVEGKKSLPVLMHLQKCPGDFEKIMNCFNRARSEGIDSPAVEECIAIVEKSGAIEEARAYSARLIDSACDKICARYSAAESPALIAALFKKMAGR